MASRSKLRAALERLRRPGPLAGATVFVVGAYVLLELWLPALGGWLASTDFFSSVENLPSSGREVPLYFALTLLATYCYLTFDERRWRAFNQPIERFMRWRDPRRSLVLAAVPLLVGGLVFTHLALGTDEPVSNPLLHPTPPDEFSRLSNPFRNPTEEMLVAFDEGLRSGEIDPEESSEPEVRAYAEALAAASATEAGRSRAYERHTIEEGRILFVTNCRPCHGTKAMGDGPMSVGQRRQPADFTGVETIATLVEGAVFWRVKKGGIRLPTVGAPWDSAMPRWETDLSEEQIWKIIMAEYDLAGNAPREPEGRAELAALAAQGEGQ